MEKMFSFEKSVGAVVFRRTDEGDLVFLLLQYRNGHWGFPKGHVEQGETEEKTLRREVLEETGIGELEIRQGFSATERYWYIAKGEELKKRQAKKQGYIVIKKVIYYLALTKIFQVKLSEEHLDFMWLEYGRAIKKLTHKNSKEILEEAYEFAFLDKRN